MQPMRSAIKCSKASRSPPRLSGGPEGTWAGGTRSQEAPWAGGAAAALSSSCSEAPGHSSVRRAGRGCGAGQGRELGAGGMRQGQRHLGAAPGSHMQITCNLWASTRLSPPRGRAGCRAGCREQRTHLSSSMLPLSASWPSLLPSVSSSSSPRSISSSFPASGRVYAYPLEREGRVV